MFVSRHFNGCTSSVIHSMVLRVLWLFHFFFSSQILAGVSYALPYMFQTTLVCRIHGCPTINPQNHQDISLAGLMPTRKTSHSIGDPSHTNGRRSVGLPIKEHLCRYLIRQRIAITTTIATNRIAITNRTFRLRITASYRS